MDRLLPNILLPFKVTQKQVALFLSLGVVSIAFIVIGIMLLNAKFLVEKPLPGELFEKG